MLSLPSTASLPIRPSEDIGTYRSSQFFAQAIAAAVRAEGRDVSSWPQAEEVRNLPHVRHRG
jgi:hypothetical protein